MDAAGAGDARYGGVWSISRQVEGANSTFRMFPAKTRIRIQFFKSFPPSDEASNLTIQNFLKVQQLKSLRVSIRYKFGERGIRTLGTKKNRTTD